MHKPYPHRGDAYILVGHRRVSVITDSKSRNYSNVTPASRKRLLALKQLHTLRTSTDRISGRYIYCKMEE